jgi:prepilin-type N-terminal cleavage/methylation domain-containing protein
MSRPRNIRRQKLNNCGFSLIELIVVIAILVVLCGSAISLVGLLNGRQAKQCRDEILSKLDSVRTTTMGKRTATATLEKDGDVYVFKISTTLNGEAPEVRTSTLDSSRVTLYYSTDAAGTGRQLLDSSLTIEFDRASGAIKAQSDGTYIRHIYAVQGSKEYGIRLYPETGKLQSE